MGINDDIKPKKQKVEEPEVIQEEEAAAEDDHEDGQVNDGIEIPIEKDKKIEPVYEDLVDRAPKPFDHLNKESVGPEYHLERIQHDRPADKSEAEDEKTRGQGLPAESKDEEERPVSRADSFKSFAEYHEKQPKKSHLLTIIIIAFVGLLALLLILQNYDQIKKVLGIQTELTTTTSQPNNSGVEVIKEENINTPITTTDTEPAAETPAEESPPPAAEPAAAPEAAPETASISSLKVKVLNGNGITGSAAAVKTKLEAAGYTIGNVSNASKFTYAKTTIYHNTNRKAEADALAAILTDRQTEVILNASVAGTFDIVVVVGKT